MISQLKFGAKTEIKNFACGYQRMWLVVTCTEKAWD